MLIEHVSDMTVVQLNLLPKGDFLHLTHLSFFFQTAYTVPILAFAFVCHPEVLPIYSELKE